MRFLLVLAASAAVLSACSDGSGDASPPTSAPASSAPSDEDYALRIASEVYGTTTPHTRLAAEAAEANCAVLDKPLMQEAQGDALDLFAQGLQKDDSTMSDAQVRAFILISAQWKCPEHSGMVAQWAAR